MSGTEAESDRRQRESCVLMKAKPPTLTLAGREHIASAADNVRLPTKRVAKEPQQADHAPSGLGNPRDVGLTENRLQSTQNHRFIRRMRVNSGRGNDPDAMFRRRTDPILILPQRAATSDYLP
jgi:hypothetical protein